MSYCWACALLGAVLSVTQCENEFAAGSEATSTSLLEATGTQAAADSSKPPGPQRGASAPSGVRSSSASAAPAAGESLDSRMESFVIAAPPGPVCWSASTGAARVMTAAETAARASSAVSAAATAEDYAFSNSE